MIAATHAAERGERFGDPVCAEEVAVDDVEFFAAEQARKAREIAGRPAVRGEGMNGHAERAKGFGENSFAVHRGDFVAEARAVRMTHEIQQRGLRAAEVEAVDDVENAEQIRVFRFLGLQVLKFLEAGARP